MEESILGLPSCDPTSSFESVNVKREVEEEEPPSSEELFNICNVHIKEEIKLEETLILDDDLTPTDTLYECERCNISFNQLRYLRKHEKTHKDILVKKLHPCGKCVKTFDSSKKLEKHLVIHNRAPATHSCPTCNKTCKSISALKVHQRSHLKSSPTCEICGKTFSETYNLMVHLRIHSGSRPYACDTCGKTFTTNSSLKVHHRTHTGERPYQCSICHKRFTTSSYLSEHNRYHNEDTPYSCDTCSKTFKTARLLKNHQSVHNPLIQLIECDHCGKMLKTSSSKRVHDKFACPKKPKNTDNEYIKEIDNEKVMIMACRVCRKEFAGRRRRSNMKRHMRLHTNDRPYSCDKCDKRYSDWTAWKSHTRTHTSEKPYHCQQCDLYFKSPNNLSRHYLNIHKLGKKTTLKPGNKK